MLNVGSCIPLQANKLSRELEKEFSSLLPEKIQEYLGILLIKLSFCSDISRCFSLPIKSLWMKRDMGKGSKKRGGVQVFCLLCPPIY